MERTENLHIRITPEEKRMLYAKAAAAGVTITALIISFLGTEKIGETLGEKLVQTVKTKNG